ncbi:hypothetical protein H5410_062711 [Solanum commersonii]|uniref:Uncharacterized protein n=1 Tax=Solanum commersonii TaxID=4109 RepID=A0A9J5WBE8_SOLCO|nr:hypothetical protein H5410_062711 [Solanum commersonii]
MEATPVGMEAAPVGMEPHDLLLLGVTSSAAAATFLCCCEGGVAAIEAGGVAPVRDGSVAPVGDGWGWAPMGVGSLQEKQSLRKGNMVPESRNLVPNEHLRPEKSGRHSS